VLTTGRGSIVDFLFRPTTNKNFVIVTSTGKNSDHSPFAPQVGDLLKELFSPLLNSFCSSKLNILPEERSRYLNKIWLVTGRQLLHPNSKGVDTFIISFLKKQPELATFFASKMRSNSSNTNANALSYINKMLKKWQVQYTHLFVSNPTQRTLPQGAVDAMLLQRRFSASSKKTNDGASSTDTDTDDDSSSSSSSSSSFSSSATITPSVTPSTTVTPPSSLS